MLLPRRPCVTTSSATTSHTWPVSLPGGGGAGGGCRRGVPVGALRQAGPPHEPVALLLAHAATHLRNAASLPGAAWWQRVPAGFWHSTHFDGIGQGQLHQMACNAATGWYPLCLVAPSGWGGKQARQQAKRGPATGCEASLCVWTACGPDDITIASSPRSSARNNVPPAPCQARPPPLPVPPPPHPPGNPDGPSGHPKAALEMLREVAGRTGRLVAMWQALGFVHGRCAARTAHPRNAMRGLATHALTRACTGRPRCWGGPRPPRCAQHGHQPACPFSAFRGRGQDAAMHAQAHAQARPRAGGGGRSACGVDYAQTCFANQDRQARGGGGAVHVHTTTTKLPRGC